ncbi:MAG: hypothetical protein WC346_04405 [Methanogenium sp.]|jgi:hypothetical protein
MKTYGKLNPLKKLCLEVKGVFKVNGYSEQTFNSKGLSCYLPKVKPKFWIAVIISVILISPLIPMGFLGTPFIMGWGIK